MEKRERERAKAGISEEDEDERRITFPGSFSLSLCDKSLSVPDVKRLKDLKCACVPVLQRPRWYPLIPSDPEGAPCSGPI